MIVVDDRSTDRTREVATEIANGDARLVVVDGAKLPAGWLGKPWALEQGAKSSRSAWILFCDADVVYGSGVVRDLVSFAEERGADAVTVFPRVEMRGFWEHVMMPMLAYAGSVIVPLWLADRTGWPRLGVGGGTGILVRRGAWERIGGHERLRDAVVDDIALVRQLRAARCRTRVVDAHDRVSVRMYHGAREIVDGFTKNLYYAIGGSVPAALATLVASSLVHLLPAYWLARVWIEWRGGLAIDPAAVAGGLALAVILATRLAVLRAFGGRLDNAVLGMPLMLGGWLWIGIRSTWHVGVRGRLDWRGRRYDARKARFGD